MTPLSIGIIGVGNPLRKDDGIGLFLLSHIKKESHYFPKTVSFVDGGTGGMNLLHIFSRFELIILLDAVDFKGQPGETRFFSIDDIQSQKQVSTVSTHNADLFQIIRLGQELEECSKKIFVFGVQPSDISFGDGLTEPLKSHIDDIKKSMKNHILKLINEQKRE
jgi:hydrogenase maturation protease